MQRLSFMPDMHFCNGHLQSIPVQEKNQKSVIFSETGVKETQRLRRHGLRPKDLKEDVDIPTQTRLTRMDLHLCSNRTAQKLWMHGHKKFENFMNVGLRAI